MIESRAMGKKHPISRNYIKNIDADNKRGYNELID
jgi:hypothetical protein